MEATQRRRLAGGGGREATDASPFRRKETKTVVAPWVLKAQKREAKAAAVIKAASKAKAMFQEGATSKVGATASSSSAEIGGPKSKGDAGRRLAPQPPSAPPPGWHAGFHAGMRAAPTKDSLSEVETERGKDSKNDNGSSRRTKYRRVEKSKHAEEDPDKASNEKKAKQRQTP